MYLSLYTSSIFAFFLFLFPLFIAKSLVLWIFFPFSLIHCVFIIIYLYRLFLFFIFFSCFFFSKSLVLRRSNPPSLMAGQRPRRERKILRSFSFLFEASAFAKLHRRALRKPMHTNNLILASVILSVGPTCVLPPSPHPSPVPTGTPSPLQALFKIPPPPPFP